MIFKRIQKSKFFKRWKMRYHLFMSTFKKRKDDQKEVYYTMNDFESYDDFIDFINPFTPYKFSKRLNIPALITEDGKDNTQRFI